MFNDTCLSYDIAFETAIIGFEYYWFEFFIQFSINWPKLFKIYQATFILQLLKVRRCQNLQLFFVIALFSRFQMDTPQSNAGAGKFQKPLFILCLRSKSYFMDSNIRNDMTSFTPIPIFQGSSNFPRVVKKAIGRCVFWGGGGISIKQIITVKPLKTDIP